MTKKTAAWNVLGWLGVVALFTSLGYAFARPGYEGPITTPTDFRAFYCAGRVVREGGDPYRVEPLRSCETSVLHAMGARRTTYLVAPVPHPPYALAFFAAIATLPYLFAASLWFGCSLAAWARTVILVQRLSSLRLGPVALVMLPLGFLAPLAYGQLMPLVIWMLVEAASSVRAGNGRTAAAWLCAALLEPHVALPAFVAVFCMQKRTRLPLAVGAAVVISLALSFGVSRLVEWFAAVVPAHAVSELRNPEQYSLTSLLAMLGAGGATARTLGSLDYAAMIVAGTWLARILARRWDDAAAYVFAPIALAVLGGPFLHEHQLAAALPFALVACSRLRRLDVYAATALLAVPWLLVAEHSPALDWAFSNTRRLELSPGRPEALAETVWAQYVALFAPASSWAVAVAELVKIPSWFGISYVAVAAAVAKRPHARSAPSNRRGVRFWREPAAGSAANRAAERQMPSTGR